MSTNHYGSNVTFSSPPVLTTPIFCLISKVYPLSVWQGQYLYLYVMSSTNYLQNSDDEIKNIWITSSLRIIMLLYLEEWYLILSLWHMRFSIALRLARKRQKKSYMVVKTNIIKSYDRHKWSFLEKTAMGFHVKWIRWIMTSLNTVSFSVLIKIYLKIMKQYGIKQSISESLSLLLDQSSLKLLKQGWWICKVFIMKVVWENI